MKKKTKRDGSLHSFHFNVPGKTQQMSWWLCGSLHLTVFIDDDNTELSGVVANEEKLSRHTTKQIANE